ncbi:BlaI/MecI/CopY family transcriptional regulator [Alcanivorax sp.]|uniref:BlaI/MecI/CopY family transcriptional regulator n=1 Tax=Alcanivorax sp. TaxID=1872427 RepID=UPI002632174F|nr:BlaI/MecI/CopY family transcriptional regulator [Alcanivorax sp.]
MKKSIPPASHSVPALGELELTVLNLLWENPGLSPKSVHAVIGAERGISVNTVQSTLDRLYKKQLLTREKQGYAYHYTAIVERDSLIANMISDVMGRFQLDGAASIAAFVQATESLADEDLARLEEEIRARRAQSGGKQ